jgi:hypothetical protein
MKVQFGLGKASDEVGGHGIIVCNGWPRAGCFPLLH